MEAWRLRVWEPVRFLVIGASDVYNARPETLMTFTPKELNAALAGLPDTASASLQIVAADWIAGQYYPHLDPAQPVLMLGLGDQAVTCKVRQALLAVYPPGHPVTCITGPDRTICSLAELDTAGDGVVGLLWIPAVSVPAAFTALLDVVAHLRAPDGCPWDRDLTWARLRASLLEESYELLAALDAQDPAKVAEEQGDLLLQIAMQAQIASEMGLFRIPDVIERIVGKLIRRHPHVFGEAHVSDTAEVLANWEAIKRAERERNGEKRSPLSGVPVGLPALAQADAYLDRMSRIQANAAPDTPSAALAGLDAAAPTPETFGDALFGLVAWARAHGIDSESALREANARYAAQVDRSQEEV